jgi:hypothetical protein
MPGHHLDADVSPGARLAKIRAGAVVGDTVADAVDPAELLDIDVDQLARVLALVADDLRLGVERGVVA